MGMAAGRWHTSAYYYMLFFYPYYCGCSYFLEKKIKKTKWSLRFDSHHHDGHFGYGRLTSSVCGAAPLRHVHIGGGMQGSGLARAVHDRNENLQLSVPCCPMSRPLCCSRASFVCRPSPAPSRRRRRASCSRCCLRLFCTSEWEVACGSGGS